MAAAATFALGLPLSIVPQILSGYQRSYVFNAATLLGTVAGFAAVVLAIRAEASMPWMVAAFGVAPITAPLAAFLYTLARIPSARPALEAVSRHAGRALSGRSLPMFLFQIGALAVNETQVIVLAHRCDLAAVADYTVLMRLYIAAMGVIQLSTASFLPTFREAWERGDEPWMRSAFRRFLGARMALAVALAGTLAAVGDPLLRLWLRRTDVAFGGAVWGAAAIMMVASTWVASHSELLAIMDRLWVQVGLVSMNGAVAIGLTYVLAPRFSLLGVVLSTSAVSIAVFSWLLPRLANRLVLRPHPG
jgi:O-antigen/teichoic acid export membrane protein